MRRDYRYTFEFKDTLEDAQNYAEQLNRAATPYMRKHHPAVVTNWTSFDGVEHKFVVWFYE